MWRLRHNGVMTGVRIAYLAAYAALAALGEALVARNALVWLRGQGLFHPALPWGVPLGGAAVLLALLMALATLWLASQAALGKRPRVVQHAIFLMLLGFCISLRSWSGDPQPPPDPAPALLEGLRTAASELDRGFQKAYAPEESRLNGVLGALPAPGYQRLGRTLPLHARIVANATGPQKDALPGDPPGTIYIAVSPDRTAAWLTALSAHGVLKPSIEAHGGTHSLPGRDPLVPAYPGMRGLTDRKK